MHNSGACSVAAAVPQVHHSCRKYQSGKQGMLGLYNIMGDCKTMRMSMTFMSKSGKRQGGCERQQTGYFFHLAFFYTINITPNYRPGG